MEFKVVIYIIAGIIYFLYQTGKKAQEKKQNSTPAETPNEAKPVTAPTPFKDIMAEIQRKQREEEARRKAAIPKPQPVTTYQQKKTEKELLIKEKQKGLFQEGNYERDLTAEEKIERGKLKIANEGIYKIKPADEMEEEQATFQLDIRNAVIGSVILERKY